MLWAVLALFDEARWVLVWPPPFEDEDDDEDDEDVVDELDAEDVGVGVVRMDAWLTSFSKFELDK